LRPGLDGGGSATVIDSEGLEIREGGHTLVIGKIKQEVTSCIELKLPWQQAPRNARPLDDLDQDTGQRIEEERLAKLLLQDVPVPGED